MKRKNGLMQNFSLDSAIEKSNIDFAGKLKWFIIAPIVLAIIAVILLLTVGFNLGIDFTGGSLMQISSNSQVNTEFKDADSFDITSDADYNEMTSRINKVLAGFDLSASVFQKTTMTINDIDVDAVLVRYQNQDDMSNEEIEELNKQIQLALLKEFGYVSEDSDITILEDDEFSKIVKNVANGGVTTASASAELLMNAFIAVLVALVLILIYIFFRFDLTSGLAAILALFQDVIVTCAFMLIFQVTVNSGFIAAIITIIGYSINNTIIIFDRIRENISSGTYLGKSNKMIANSAVKETMSRSIFTTLTTFLVIFFVLVIGVSDIRDFAFPILIGILAGFYSSVFLTPGLWAIAYHGKRKSVKKESIKSSKEPEYQV